MEPSDASPLKAAWREIQEETKLTPKLLRLRRQGKPYSFIDAALRREWTIYPFAFELAPSGEGEVEITTDWEHEGWDWFDPRSVKDDESFGGVPNLATSLRRSWFEYDLGDGAGGVLARGLEALQRDRQSGAAVLAMKALGVLGDVMVALEGEKEEWWRNVRMGAWHLAKNGRESMGAAILNATLACLREVETEILPRWDSLKRLEREDAIWDIIAKYGERRQPLKDAISRSFSAFLQANCSPDRPVRVLTLSSSSTIAKSLSDALHFSGFALDIRILESRPLFEGAAMAAEIADGMDGLAGAEGPGDNRVTVYTDAQAALAAQEVDLVLLGADIVSAAGDVCNKAGSLPAVLSAKHVSPGAKVVVVADRDKVWHRAAPEPEEGWRGEVTDTWRRVEGAAEAGRSIRYEHPRAGEVRNFYFEWVEAGLVDHYVTEEGEMSKGDVGALAKEVEKTEAHFFDGV